MAVHSDSGSAALLTYGSFTKESPKELAPWFPAPFPDPDPVYAVNPPGGTEGEEEGWREWEERVK